MILRIVRVSSIKYNPRLSVKENAIKNNCSEAAIRYFIRVNHIDRQSDGINKRLITYRTAYREGDTPISLQKKTGGSVNTIKKYWTYITGEEEPSKLDKNKLQKLTLRQLRDYYATHPSVTDDILREEKFNYDILEPCCGGGFMAERIKTAGYNVYACDIVDRGYGKGGVDFFTAKFEEGKYDIITNPPYTQLVPFVQKALRIAKNKVAILMPLRYLSSQERYNGLFKDQPPQRVYAYIERICIAKNGDFEKYNDAGANMEIYAWFVWEKGHNKKTELHWINNIKIDN